MSRLNEIIRLSTWVERRVIRPLLLSNICAKIAQNGRTQHRLAMNAVPRRSLKKKLEEGLSFVNSVSTPKVPGSVELWALRLIPGSATNRMHTPLRDWPNPDRQTIHPVGKESQEMNTSCGAQAAFSSASSNADWLWKDIPFRNRAWIARWITESANGLGDSSMLKGRGIR